MVRKINGRQTANLKTTQKVQDLVNWAEFKLLLVENVVEGAWVDLRICGSLSQLDLRKSQYALGVVMSEICVKFKMLRYRSQDSMHLRGK